MSVVLTRLDCTRYVFEANIEHDNNHMGSKSWVLCRNRILKSTGFWVRSEDSRILGLLVSRDKFKLRLLNIGSNMCKGVCVCPSVTRPLVHFAHVQLKSLIGHCPMAKWYCQQVISSKPNEWGEPTASYRWTAWVWERTGWKFKTSGNLPIILEESMEYTAK